MRTGKLLIMVAMLALALGAWAAIAAAAPAGPDGDTRATVPEKAPISVASPARAPGKVTPAAHPQAVLWDQPLSTVSQAAYVNQEFTDFPAYSSFLADDFINPAPWNIGTIFIPGDGWNGFTTLLNATGLTWQIYADCAGVPCGDPSGGGSPPVWTLTLAPTDPQVVISNGTPGGLPSDTTLNLPAPINLPPGHWWLVFYPTLDFTNYGQHGRQAADTANGYVGQFINPGGGFGFGTAWQNWTVLGPAQQDIAFRLEGPVGPFIVWDKYIDGIPWTPQMQITRQTSDTIVVEEVLHLMPGAPGSRVSPAAQPAKRAPAATPPGGGSWAGGGYSVPEDSGVGLPPTPKRYTGPDALVYYGDRATFNAEHPGLPIEGFENTLVPNGGIVPCPGPFDSSTNNACFAPGGILDGIRLMNVDPNNDMVVIGDGALGQPSALAGPNTFADHQDITFFNGNPHAVGFDLWSPNGAATFDLYIYGPGDVLLGQTSVVAATTGTFWGVYSDELITRIRTESAAGAGELFDDIAFGGGAVFAQIETWNPAHLRLLDWAATGGEVFIAPGRLEWTGEIVAPATITLTKWFHVEPCTWTETLLWEELWLDGHELEQRPVIVNKLAPALWIDAIYDGDVYAGEPANFTLLFGNTGGFDNDVWIQNNFPATAPFVSSVPPPTYVDPGGLWAQWLVGGLPQGAQGAIDVTVMIEPTLPPSTTIEIWDGIFDHTGELRDWVIIMFHVEPREQYIYLPVVYKNYMGHP